jgi:hypothetical protein
MTMTKKPWTPEREAALAAKAEVGFDAADIGAAVPNPLRKAGRPSLSPGGGTSKVLNTRIPSDLHGKVVAFARETGRSVSDLTRDALSAFLPADPEPPPAAVTKRSTGGKRSATKRSGRRTRRTDRAAS